MPVISTDAAAAGVRAELDGRDTASRSRANHTGTQAAATIADFGTVAAAAAPVQSVAGRDGAVVLSKADVGLANVDNTSDAAKPVSTATQTALDLKANTAALAAVATSGQYSALLGIPSTFAPAAHDQAWSTITSTPTTLAGYGIADAATAAQGLLADSAVQPGAIANFETTTQLNARDTANRARANHTGTQAAATVTGLATVATSGGYADLSGKPTLAFTYDQQTEPVGPAAGATWRERSGSGLTVGNWEWSGSLWTSTTLFRESFFFNFITARTIFATNASPFKPSGQLLITQFNATSTVTVIPDGTKNWTLSLELLRKNGITLAGVTTIDAISGLSILVTPFNAPVETIFTTPILVSNTNGIARINIVATPVGSAGNLGSVGSMHWKIVRG